MKKLFAFLLVFFSCVVSAQDFGCKEESLSDMAWRETCVFVGQNISSSYKAVREQHKETEAKYIKERIPRKTVTYVMGSDNDSVKINYVWRSKTHLLITFDYQVSSAVVQWVFKQKKHKTVFIKTVFPP